MLMTSRPGSIDQFAERVKPFPRFELAALDSEQQAKVITQRLSDEGKARQLLQYIYSPLVPTDPSTGARVTSNPLMLAMYILVFELSEGKSNCHPSLTTPRLAVNLGSVCASCQALTVRWRCARRPSVCVCVCVRSADDPQRAVQHGHEDHAQPKWREGR